MDKLYSNNQSGKYDENRQRNQSNCKFKPLKIYHWFTDAPGEQVAVKIRGLPYSVRYEEVADFFGDFSIVPKSVVLGLNQDGRKNGFGAILFESEGEAARAAKEMNQQYVGNRYVDLSVITYADYKSFNGPP